MNPGTIGLCLLLWYDQPVDQDVAILTPEKAIVTYRLAGLGSRMLAHLVDVILVIGLLIIIVAALAALGLVMSSSIVFGFLLIAAFAIPFLYFILQEAFWNGQTVGKKVAGCRVRMADGTPITPAAAVGRNLMRPADMLPGTYLIGLIAVFTNPKSQRIGDLAANTIVCLERKPVQMYAVAPHKAGFHALEISVGELRGMTMEEYVALRRFADRFPELSTKTQNRLIAEVFVPIADRRGVPHTPQVHPIYQAEAMVMKYGRENGLL